jgi:adenine-specific DNA-methyltransferase
MKQIDSQTRLKSLLRELFQLDVADLDFGLYRLFHLKRDEVEAFLNKQLPAEVDRAFEAAAGAERAALQKRVDDLAERARASVADDAVLPSGEPNPAHAAAKAVKEYVEALNRLQAVEASEAQRSEVFNLLYAFFSRYYDEGDFIPRRFYGARASYAVTYNGEEVFFHWANKDQHYVKSGEAFRDYAFTISTVSAEYRVRFRPVEATAPKDDTKGDIRFFFPLPKEAMFDKATRTFTVPFHYRLPTEAEVAKYGKNARAQEAILDEAAPKILEAATDEFLRSALAAPSPSGRPAEGEEPPTLLRRRLRHFTKKNTTDYFVHKDLGAFLRQALEFFVRDQVVHEADLEGDFDAKRRTIRVFRKLAETLITFLAQIEDAQKRLFEKKKFVLRTDYLVPIQNVPRALWPEVLANKAQLTEWKERFALAPKSDLFNVKGKVNEHVLEQHPTLVVSTAHFPPEDRLRFLSGFSSLADAVDGVVVCADNFQAASLLGKGILGDVGCVYLDPPFNTSELTFLYKNRYQHSSWLAMMASRLELARRLLDEEGTLLVAIDDEELYNLKHLLDKLFGPDNFLGALVIQTNPRGRTIDSYFATSHEYCLAYAVDASHASIRDLPLTEDQAGAFALKDAVSAYRLLPFRRSGGLSTPRERPNSYYPIYYDENTGKIAVEAFKGATEILPIDSKGQPRVWRQTKPSLMAAVGRGDVVIKRNGDDFTVFLKDRIKEGRKPKTVWVGPQFDASTHGTVLLEKMFGKAKTFSYPKSIHTVQQCLAVATSPDERFVVDLFAGSGTTAHAVINLNREDGGGRKFVLTEVEQYFDSVLLPRIQKVMFTPEWKDGKPARLPTKEEAERTPRLVKVLRLESYEDALHNTFSETSVERLAEREKAHRDAVAEDGYRLRYLVTLPVDASDSMLNLAKLEHPFDYTLEVLTDHGPKTETVDLVETFNWLYGLRVHRFLTWANEKDKAVKERDGRSYRAVVASDREGKKRILVVWRDMTDLDPKVERPFLEAKAGELGTFEEQWINGDTAAKGFASLDGLFKRLMEEGER